jgi:single-stranded DNA-binding protein
MDYQRISASLIGNTTQDGAVKQAKESGKSYGDFRLAVRDRQGETHYYPIRCFGKLAASVTVIKKGAKVFVAGELEMGSFVGEDGQQQVLFRVIAATYRILGDGRQTDKTESASV